MASFFNVGKTCTCCSTWEKHTILGRWVVVGGYQLGKKKRSTPGLFFAFHTPLVWTHQNPPTYVEGTGMVRVTKHLPIPLPGCALYITWQVWKPMTITKWCKYHYHKVLEKTFQDAKDAVKKYLEACPAEVIHRSTVNFSWHFMSAYWLGLTGNAAAWAAKKQWQYQQVSQRVMMSIETVLN